MSVVIAVYNGRAYLAETIRGFLTQTEKEFEIVFVDDGSTDGSAELIASFNDPRFRVLRNEHNLRLVETRNRGIAAARGRYVAICDQDDVPTPHRLSRQADHLDAFPRTSLVAGWIRTVDSNGLPSGQDVYRRYSPAQLKASLVFRNGISHSTVMLRRAALPNPPYVEEFPLCEDYQLIVRLGRAGDVVLLPEVLCHYRIHGGNYSLQAAQRTRQLAALVKSEALHGYGIQPDAHELQVNNELEYLDPEVGVTESDLARFRPWLEKVHATRLTNPEDQAALRMLAAQEWYEACQKATVSCGWRAWQAYRDSPLSRESQIDRTRRTLLLVKAARSAFRRVRR